MKKAKILLVDDDPDIINALQIILENQGYEVVSANNKTDGLNLALNENPDLVILDVMMTTTQEGFELSRELRKEPRFRHLPIIMLTSIDSKTGVNFKSAAGEDDLIPVNAYIDKPAQPHLILEEVKRLLKNDI
jgi:two-component system, OmpR family, alkaline phosphatase synthesis response regulator PhoP